VNYRALVDKKIAEAFRKEWHPQRPSRADIFETNDAIGLRFYVQNKDACWTLVHEEPPVSLADEIQAEDLVARGISSFLMEHPLWPK